LLIYTLSISQGRGVRKMVVERSEYQGKPMIVLKRNENDRYPFMFGLSKAKLVVENIEEVKKFIAENDQPA